MIKPQEELEVELQTEYGRIDEEGAWHWYSRPMYWGRLILYIFGEKLVCLAKIEKGLYDENPTRGQRELQRLMMISTGAAIQKKIEHQRILLRKFERMGIGEES